MPATVLVDGVFRTAVSCEQADVRVAGLASIVYKPEDSEENSGKASQMLRPDRFAPRLHDVSLRDLSDGGFRGIIVDLDNTLVAYRQAEVVKDHLEWIAEAQERGFRVVMLSNNFSDRVGRIAQQLKVLSVPNALKPLPFGFARALHALNLPRNQVLVVGDQLFTDVLGAKVFGLYTILTEPIEPHDFAITRVFRFLERLALRRRGAQ